MKRALTAKLVMRSWNEDQFTKHLCQCSYNGNYGHTV